MRKHAKSLLALTLTLMLSGVGLSHLKAEEAPKDTAKEEQKATKAVGGQAGEKGGIYVVGRAFKKTGHTMEKGFVKAGKGMEKGFKKAGSEMEKGFKKAGGSMKDFFTGEKSDK